MYLALDLSLTRTGWALFDNDGVLEKYGNISPDPKLSNPFKLHYIVSQLSNLFQKSAHLVVEDLWLGINFRGIKELAKLAGAVEFAWVSLKYNNPKFFQASTARKLVGLNGRASKAEVQLWAIANYHLVSTSLYKKFYSKFSEIKSQFAEKKITSRSYKSQLTKLSKLIEKETNIGNDVADAIVVGKAFSVLEEK